MEFIGTHLGEHMILRYLEPYRVRDPDIHPDYRIPGEGIEGPT